MCRHKLVRWAKAIVNKTSPVIILLMFPALVFFGFDWMNDYSSNNSVETGISTIAGIVGTIMAIVFSMMLLIVERIADKYSPKFLHYIVRNRTYIITILCSAALIMFCLLPIPISDSSRFQIALSGCAMFLILFILSLKETVQLMNPKYSILEPEVRNIGRWLNRELRRIENMQTKNAFNNRAYNIPDTLEVQLEERLLPIRDIVIRSISSNNIQEATDGINAFTEVVLTYLRCRKNFLNDNDQFMFFVYSEYQNIASNALGTGYLHLRIHPLLIKSLGRISEEALKVKVNRTQATSTNYLISFLVKGMRDLCLRNLKYQNSSAPSVACEVLERIGLFALGEGFIDEAASITKSLSRVSNIILTSSSSDLFFLSRRANAAIMKIATSMAYERNTFYAKYNFNYALRGTIGMVIKDTIETLVEKKDINYSFMDPIAPFMCELYEMTPNNKFNLVNFVDNLILFTDRPHLVNEGLEYISSEVYSQIYWRIAMKIGDKTKVRSKKFVDTVYMNQLTVLSLFNSKLRAVLLGEDTKAISDLDKEKAMHVFEDGINILWNHFNSASRQKHSNNHTLDAIFSLLIIGLLDGNTDKVVHTHIKDIIRKIYRDYCSRNFTPQDTFFKYCRMLNIFVKTVTGTKKNVLVNVPKYKVESRAVYLFNAGNGSLPLEDYAESLFFSRSGSRQQWKILGTHTIRNKFFNQLNDRIWGDSVPRG